MARPTKDQSEPVFLTDCSYVCRNYFTTILLQGILYYMNKRHRRHAADVSEDRGGGCIVIVILRVRTRPRVCVVIIFMAVVVDGGEGEGEGEGMHHHRLRDHL